VGLNVILATLGSSGDVNPFIAIGRAMVARGHDATLVTNPHFESAARQAGLDFAPVHTTEEYERITSHPDLWHPVRGILVLSREVVIRGLAPVYEAIERRRGMGKPVVVASALTFGARVAHETMAVPLVTVILQPFCVRSLIDPPFMPFRKTARCFGRLGMRGLYRIGDYLIDGVVRRATNDFRASFGLPPVHRLMDKWWFSPQRAVGVWPDWYAPPQADWPGNVHATDFVFHDTAPAAGQADAAEEFFSNGDPPVVFTPGTAMRQGRDFLAAGAEACRLLGCRGALVTPHAEQVPDRLPGVVVHVPYVPFGEYLHRASAIVHHGGIGTVAQGLSAGIPQVVRPMGFDQFDNGARLERLGIGASIPRRAFRARRVAKVLDRLLTSDSVASRARKCAERIDKDRGTRLTCEAIEEIAAAS
jgi:UDP:flavonoid glycosyltransferase YjiC (YdhE family)